MKESPINNQLSVAYSYIASVDLKTGKIQVLKSHTPTTKSLNSFNAFNRSLQKSQVENDVLFPYQTEYYEFIDMTTVSERLKGRDSLTCIFQRKNLDWTLSAIVPQQTDAKGNVISVLIANRDITEIHNWEQEQMHSLEMALKKSEKALTELKKSTEIISSISSIYWAIYVIHIKEDTYEEVNGGEILPKYIHKTGKATEMMETGLKYIVSDEDQSAMIEFLNLKTLPERMQNETTIVKDYRTISNHWHMGRFIVKSRDDLGNVDTVIFAVNVIDERKQNELNYQRTIQANYKKMDEINHILTALANDYEDVYLCDLEKDTLQIIKENDSHLSSGNQTKQYSYSSRQKEFCENIIEDDEDLLHFMRRENLLEYFKDHHDISIQYKVKPNYMGYSNVETKLVRVKLQDTVKVIMGSRKIDQIVKKQEEQKKQLQHALDIANKNADIIGTIATMYDTIFLENLKTKTYEMINSIDSISNISGKTGYLDDIREETLSAMVVDEMKDQVREFVDPNTLPIRLKDKNSIAMEYHGPNDCWYRAHFIVKKRDVDNNVEEVLFVSKDITLDKKQEIEYQQKLIETAQEAEKANATKTDFLRRMSHDIRTPINGIRGMLYISNHNIGNIQKQKECNDKIEKATNNLLSLVNDVLDMNKLESGNYTLKHVPFNLKQILDEVHVVVESQAKEYGIHFVPQNTNEIEHVNLIGSPDYLKRIFINFISNAIKYNEEGGHVFVYGKEISFDGKIAWYEFICEDNGIGMSEEFLKHAFEPFSQEEQAQVRTKYTGTGLGLSISKSLIELLGGNVNIQSTLHKGTRVVFQLPLEVDLEVHEEDQETDYCSILFPNKNVLLVEDNELNAEIAIFLLQQHGMQVKWVENGKLAVDEMLANPNTYDVIFMDIMMPVMNGLEASIAIRNMNIATPIFAMTANAFTDDVQRSLDAGMNEHLTKPLKENDIMRTLLKYFKS